MTTERYIMIRPADGNDDRRAWIQIQWDGRSDMTHHVTSIYPDAFTSGTLHSMERCVAGGRQTVASYGERYM